MKGRSDVTKGEQVSPVQGPVHATKEGDLRVLRCRVCHATRPLEPTGWTEAFNSFVAQHQHADPDAS